MFCPKCGNQLPANSVFCDSCGARIVNTADHTATQEPVHMRPESHTQQPDNKNEKSGNKLPAIIGALALVALIAGFLFYWVGARTGKDTGTEQQMAAKIQDAVVNDEKAHADVPDQTQADSKMNLETKETSEISNDTAPETAEAFLESKESSVAVKENTEKTTEISKEPASLAELADFDWADSALPTGTTTYSDLEKASGKWKGLMAVSPSEDSDGRFVLSTTEIQYYENVVTIYMDVIATYTSSYESPKDYQLHDTPKSAIIQLTGKWVEDKGAIYVTSTSSELRVVLKEFYENEDSEYAVGETYNGDTPLGNLYLVRP